MYRSLTLSLYREDKTRVSQKHLRPKHLVSERSTKTKPPRGPWTSPGNPYEPIATNVRKAKPKNHKKAHRAKLNMERVMKTRKPKRA